MTFKGDDSARLPDAAADPSQTPPPASTEEPTYVTKDYFDNAIGTFTKELQTRLDNFFRGVQSQGDKLEARVQKRLTDLTTKAQEQGLTLTDADKTNLRAQVVNEMLNEAGAAPQATPPGSEETPRSGEEIVQQVNQIATGIMQLSGVLIDDNDPEADILKKAGSGTPDAYIKAVWEAVEAKRLRLQGTNELPGSPRARTPGVVAGAPQANRIANITDLDTLWKEAAGK